MSRREARAIGKLTGAAVGKAAEALEAAAERDIAAKEAGEGPLALVKTYLASSASLRAQAEKFLADAAEAEAKGKSGKAARLRKGAERPSRQADEWEAKAVRQVELDRDEAAEYRARRSAEG